MTNNDDEPSRSPQPRGQRWSRLWRASRPVLKVISAGLVSWALRKLLG